MLEFTPEQHLQVLGHQSSPSEGSGLCPVRWAGWGLVGCAAWFPLVTGGTHGGGGWVIPSSPEATNRATHPQHSSQDHIPMLGIGTQLQFCRLTRGCVSLFTPGSPLTSLLSHAHMSRGYMNISNQILLLMYARD